MLTLYLDDVDDFWINFLALYYSMDPFFTLGYVLHHNRIYLVDNMPSPAFPFCKQQKLDKSWGRG